MLRVLAGRGSGGAGCGVGVSGARRHLEYRVLRVLAGLLLGALRVRERRHLRLPLFLQAQRLLAKRARVVQGPLSLHEPVVRADRRHLASRT